MTEREFNRRLEGLIDHLSSLAKKFTPDHDDAKDLIQETLLKALRHREKFTRDENLGGWLYYIMKNTFINQYRKKTREGTYLDLSENLFQLNTTDPHTFRNPESEMVYRDIIRHSARVESILLIPLKMYFMGFKYHEIADKLGVPVGTIKNRIFHARRQMKAIIQE